MLSITFFLNIHIDSKCIYILHWCRSKHFISVFMLSKKNKIIMIIDNLQPLFTGAFSDAYGNRRHLYLIVLILFTVPSIVCALIKNIWVLIMMRAIQACGS